MKQIIKIERILEYYDVPQVFVGTDIFCAKYLCMLYNDETEFKYVAVYISPKQLNKYLKTEIDLRQIFLTPEMSESYFEIVYSNNDFEIIAQRNGTIPENMLPEEGFYNNSNEDIDNSLIADTYSLNRPVTYIGFEDPINSPTIEVPILAQALKHYQSLVSHCYTKIDGKQGDADPRLRAYLAETGSFNIRMYAESTLDVFHNSRMEKTFSVIDDILNFQNEDELRDKLQELKGHTVGSYKNLITLLVENKLSLKYKWVSSSRGSGHKAINRYINIENINRIYNVLKESNELENEIREFNGCFTKIDINTGAWKLYDHDIRKSFSGITELKDLISGITVSTVFYKITCQEILEFNNVNAGEKITYKLLSVEAL